jgi:nucleoside-diphosphate-sugar epimerase
MKILVTGGAGAVGSNLINELIKENEIVVIDDLSSGHIENLPDGVTFVEGSICDESILEKVFSGKIDVVYHLAAFFANQNSIEHPVDDLKVNGEGTLKLLMHSVKNKVDRFIYSSSSCVYGNKDGELQEEDTNYDIGTPYAMTKLLGEHYVNLYSKLYGLKTVILRYFNSYGPGEKPGMYRNVIPNWIDLALKGKELVITGTGHETRDFTYVGDIVKGTILAGNNKNAVGKVINLGNGKDTEIVKIAEMINKITGNKAGINYKPKREWDHVMKRKADITHAMDVLGYLPKIELEEGIKKTVDWIKELK